MDPDLPYWSRGFANQTTPYDGSLSQAETVIIGAGLGGLSAAYHILRAQPQRQVVVLEADRIGAGASTRSTGMVTPGVGQNLVALVKRVGAPMARAMYEETLTAVRYVGELVEREGFDCQLRMPGMLILAHGSSGSARLDAQAKALEALDLPCERLDTAALEQRIRLGLAPSKNATRNAVAALRLPIAAMLHPGKLIHALADRIREMGGTIFEKARVTRIERNRPAILSLEGGHQIVAQDVILTTSGYTIETGIFVGRVLPLHLRALVTRPLTEAAFEAIGWHGRECIIDSRRLFNYFRLTDDDRIVFGGGPPRYRWGGHTGDHPGAGSDLDRLAAEMARTFPARAGIRADYGWTGVIGYVLDTLPAMQRLTQYPAVIHMGGWCGHGVALSISAGAWIAHMLEHGKPPRELPWFRPQPPLLPVEPVRWTGIKLGIGAMSLMDHI